MISGPYRCLLENKREIERTSVGTNLILDGPGGLLILETNEYLSLNYRVKSSEISAEFDFCRPSHNNFKSDLFYS